jgi:hypothetical protein
MLTFYRRMIQTWYHNWKVDIDTSYLLYSHFTVLMQFYHTVDLCSYHSQETKNDSKCWQGWGVGRNTTHR